MQQNYDSQQAGAVWLCLLAWQFWDLLWVTGGAYFWGPAMNSQYTEYSPQDFWHDSRTAEVANYSTYTHVLQFEKGGGGCPQF